MLAAGASGCDIVQGFRNAGDAIFPTEQVYLDAPGYRLVEGGYRWLRFTSGSDLYLLARSSDPNDESLYSMRYADPKPCVIPNVSEYAPGQGTYSGPAMVAYHVSGVDGTLLRFADANCKVYDLSIPDGQLGFVELAQGFVMMAGSELVLADPVGGVSTSIIKDVQTIWQSALGSFAIVQSKGQLYVFNTQWQSVQTFGSGVTSAGTLGQAFYFLDSTGLHKLSASGSTAVEEVIAGSDACSLDFPPTLGSVSWLTYREPCDGGSLYAYSNSSKRASKLDVPATATRVSPLPAWPKTEGDPATDAYYFFYTVNGDSDGNVSLYVRTPKKEDHKIGDKSTLDRVYVVASDQGTHGYALVDIDPSSSTGRYVEWQEPSGEVSTLGSGEPRYTSDLLLDYDGSVGSFALLQPSEAVIVARDVPGSYYRFTDSKARWTGLLSQYDGKVADLSYAEGSLSFSDFAQATANPSSPRPIPTLTKIAQGVRPDWRCRFLYSLPGISYLTDYDETNDIGRLEYRNLELGFTAVVSEGVSDYISTGDSVIYSVPFGDGDGIWVVRAR